jgi:hypothetical protein
VPHFAFQYVTRAEFKFRAFRVASVLVVDRDQVRRRGLSVA